jgi:tRNA (guanine-N(7)-)-methyltransferase
VTVAARRSVFADRLLEFPEFVLSDGREFTRRGAWRAFFADRIGGETFDGRVIFEIGCNDAELLADVAAAHPSTAFIGIDWKARAIHTAAQRVAAADLRNVALLHARAQDIRRLVGDGELDEIWIFHPEPLDNPRELPNRLIAEPFLIDAHHVLHARGLLTIKTDHGGYFDAIVELIGRMRDRFDMVIISGDLWNERLDRPAQLALAERAFAGRLTLFERRFVRKRKPIYFVMIRRRGASTADDAIPRP